MQNTMFSDELSVFTLGHQMQLFVQLEFLQKSFPASTKILLYAGFEIQTLFFSILGGGTDELRLEKGFYPILYGRCTSRKGKNSLKSCLFRHF